MYFVKTPQSKQEFEQYFNFRWQLLRAPWQQKLGSEQDEFELQASHRMIVDTQGNIVAVGRLHKMSQTEAQIRYMAVAKHCQGQGLGRLILNALEQQAQLQGVKRIFLHSRDTAQAFYEALDYHKLAESHILYGDIKHVLMEKNLPSLLTHQQHAAQKLNDTWHNTIPMSKAMNMEVSYYDMEQLVTTCDIAFNKNLHNTMFAGSVYTQATLTGWGWVYFMLEQACLAGDIVLADANIRYLKPIEGAASGHVSKQAVQGDVAVLANGKKAKLIVSVSMCCGDLVAALFEGKYVVLPKGNINE